MGLIKSRTISPEAPTGTLLPVGDEVTDVDGEEAMEGESIWMANLLDLGFLVSTAGLGRCVSTASISTNKHPDQHHHFLHSSSTSSYLCIAFPHSHMLLESIQSRCVEGS